MTAQINKGEDKKECFVIMPFGGWFDTYFKEVYVPAIESAGFKAVRADDFYRPGNIVNDIWNCTKNSELILADLTDKNPNVFYELGLANAITKPAILITATMEDVPFDLRSLRVIEYNKSFPNWGEILKDKISRAIKETIKSPEEAIPPTFLETKSTKKLSVSSDSKEILKIRSELESLKREVRTYPFRREVDFEDDDAERIFSFVHSNLLHGAMTEKEIFENLSAKGIPDTIIYGNIQLARKELKE